MNVLEIINLVVNIINIIFFGILLYIGIIIMKHIPKGGPPVESGTEPGTPGLHTTLGNIFTKAIPETKEVKETHEISEKSKQDYILKTPRTLDQAENQAKYNNDYNCKPAISQDYFKHDKTVKSENCIPKHFTEQEAADVCLGVSNYNNSCNLVNPENKLGYQKELCGDNYYCAVDHTDSCDYGVCDLKEKDKYDFGNQSICKCQAATHDKTLKPGQGRMCEKGTNCSKYQTYRKPTELLHFPELRCWYHACHGSPTWMDVPNIKSRLESRVLEAQAI